MKTGIKVLQTVHIPPWQECQQQVQARHVGCSIHPSSSLCSGEGCRAAGACSDRRHRGATAAPLPASVLLRSFSICLALFCPRESAAALYQCKLANPASSLCLPVWISKDAERGGAPLEPFPSYLVPTVLHNLLMPQIDKEELPCWER